MGNSTLSKEDLQSIRQSTKYNKGEIKKIFKDFKTHDSDGNGTFDKKEFITYFKDKFPTYTQSDLVKLFHTMDKDNSGTISFKELSATLSIISTGSIYDKLDLLFDIFDVNKDNRLERSEIKDMYDLMAFSGSRFGLSFSEANEMGIKITNEMDVNGDGIIERSDWIRIGAENRAILILLGFQ
ncbi:calcium-binding protein [Cavenderia fasciculata]|uniref:Calcium-binding protein n=1 Tax=Cavenderia fasciculata TaxID=261658 RepID=F4PVR5_CACFS|nr:calcium-binding protein [Cavenderia fasciculata]EGG20079.1 calcium-binding protein [Cavenderia fasciculata]|eukprot:XP_004367062.1 calcium-binding protein [Cavenderia fasciculata]